jgi:hypothetical protein
MKMSFIFAAFYPFHSPVNVSLDKITTVRVREGVSAGITNVYWPLTHERGCERLEVIMRFLSSKTFAKLPGCMLENLFSPNSPT